MLNFNDKGKIALLRMEKGLHCIGVYNGWQKYFLFWGNVFPFFCSRESLISFSMAGIKAVLKAILLAPFKDYFLFDWLQNKTLLLNNLPTIINFKKHL